MYDFLPVMRTGSHMKMMKFRWSSHHWDKCLIHARRYCTAPTMVNKLTTVHYIRENKLVGELKIGAAIGLLSELIFDLPRMSIWYCIVAGTRGTCFES